jgi:C-terminal processing protease CtpA/Prc
LGLLRVFPPKIKHGKTYRTIKYKPSKKRHYNGQVFVLINGMSFSASSQTATFLKENSNAIIIGEETGGGSRAINGMQIPVLRLPESRLLIHIPQVHLKYQLGKDEGKGVMPDIPIHYTLDDVLAHKKLEWEAVLNWITSQPAVKNH